ncbi:TPA: restriction endonuclease subunit S [Citrobacter freundii]|nr:restriction endonuclease subunit S [Citrobacter freundii]HBN5501008.1 restriction endonuclease subunit S [Citrobacter freundii]HBU9124213.1 restriction endonuclease subunit S [Citrobacter freundii]
MGELIRMLDNKSLVAPHGATPIGYKQTEAGVIPEDWEIRKLKDISPSQSVGLVINPSSYYSGKGTVPMLVGSHVFENRIIWINANTITEASNAKLLASRLNAGDLVTVRVGEPGITAVVPKELDQANCASMMIIRKGKNFDSFWLSYLMNSKIGKSRIEGVQYGTAQKQFNIVDAVDFIFPFPSKPEQTAIANVLSDTDAFIATLEQLVAKKQAIKTATMQQLLTGLTRISGFNGTWRCSELKHLVSTPITDGPHMTPKFYDTGVPFLSVNNLVNNRINLADLRYISKKDDELFSKKCKPKKGDVLIGKAASVGKVAFVEETFDFNIWSPIALIRANNSIDPKFLYYQMMSACSVAQIMLFTNSSSQGNIGMSDIEKIEIRFPDNLKEQTRIATILSDMDAELAALERKLAKVRDLKQGMMQQLLTGRIRLPLDQQP